MYNEKLIAKASSQYGVSEIKGSKHNPVILNYLASVAQWLAKRDETAWCAAFVTWCAEDIVPSAPSTARAKNWLDYGVALTLEEAKEGDVVILSRGRGRYHVAFLMSKTSKYIWVLGGNQGNRVCAKKYNLNKIRGIRRL